MGLARVGLDTHAFSDEQRRSASMTGCGRKAGFTSKAYHGPTCSTTGVLEFQLELHESVAAFPEYSTRSYTGIRCVHAGIIALAACQDASKMSGKRGIAALRVGGLRIIAAESGTEPMVQLEARAF